MHTHTYILLIVFYKYLVLIFCQTFEVKYASTDYLFAVEHQYQNFQELSVKWKGEWNHNEEWQTWHWILIFLTSLKFLYREVNGRYTICVDQLGS